MIIITKSNGKRSPKVEDMDDATIIQYYLDGMKAQDKYEKIYEDAKARGDEKVVSNVSFHLMITRDSLMALIGEIKFRELEWIEE